MRNLLPTVEVTDENLESAVSAIRVRTKPSRAVSSRVMGILEDVRRRGDAALRDYERQFDGVELAGRSLRVSEREITRGAESAGPEAVKALRYSLARVLTVQGRLLPRPTRSTVGVNGFRISTKWSPLPSVGCYVPGGRAYYPSSVVMTAGVAKLAGVERVVLATPPDKDGEINPEVLAAASVVGVDEVYRVGGPQAIAALAYGTESIKRVSKIVGPGGRYVSEAKHLVSRETAIDFYAGPTEIVVLAGRGCDPRIAAWELVGQAEHGEDTLCGLVTCSSELATDVKSRLAEIVPSVPRREYVEESLGRGFAAICRDESAACGFVSVLAPEHLEILSDEANRLDAKIHGPGLKLIGPFSPCAASDYVVGTDHVIPTMGLASGRGALSALDFLKLEWGVSGSKSGLRSALGPLRTLSSAEGLQNHYLSAEARFEEGKL